MQTIGSDSIDKEPTSQDGDESVSVSVNWQEGIELILMNQSAQPIFSSYLTLLFIIKSGKNPQNNTNNAGAHNSPISRICRYCTCMLCSNALGYLTKEQKMCFMTVRPSVTLSVLV
ncbi:MAG: hypothetical protein DID91_2727703291 [Candidatus Nitrotoga sp. MKT]|nr:MAG: hypothetical protein DID91_2727703291 [Candidatus Nitrotoga sp. MKT]